MLGRVPCDCCGACTIRRDNFNRPDETFGATDSTGNWLDGGAPKFQIVSDQLVCTTAGTSANQFSPFIEHLEHDPHFGLKASIKVNPVAGGKIRLALSIEPPNIHSIDFLKAGVEVTAAEEGATCGLIQLVVEDSGTGNWVALGDPIPLQGFVEGDFYTLTLCLDWDLNFVSAAVSGRTIQTQGHFAIDVLHVTSSSGSNGPLFTIRSELWVDRTVTGTYTFDDFSLYATASAGSYYYYYYYSDDQCRCCGADCQRNGVAFDNPDNDDKSADEIDCRLSVDAGTAVQTAPALQMTDGTTLSWLGSWKGLNSDCEVDYSAAITAVFSASDYGQKLRLQLGPDVWADITIESAEDANDGTITLSTGDMETVDGLNPGVSITACFVVYGEAIAVTVSIAEIFGGDAFNDAAFPDGPPAAALAPSLVATGDLALESLIITHCIIDSCDCFTDNDIIDTPCLSPGACIDDACPRNGLFRVSQPGGECRPCADWFNGSFVAGLSPATPDPGAPPDNCTPSWDSGVFCFDDLDCAQHFGAISDPRVCFRIQCALQKDVDGWRMYGTITALSKCPGPFGGSAFTTTFSFVSAVLAPPEDNAVECVGLRVSMPYVSADPDPDSVATCPFGGPPDFTCDFRHSTLEFAAA